MSVQVNEFRLSLVNAETNVPLFGDDALLSAEAKFTRHFEAVQKKDPAFAEFRLPWGDSRGKSFWTYYLEADPQSVAGWPAWKKFVPLRHKVPMTITAAWLEGIVSVAGYLYPFGQTATV